MKAALYYYLRTVAGPDRLSDEERARHWQILRTISDARQACDPAPIIDLLAEDAEWACQAVMDDLTGKAALTDYFQKRFRFFATQKKERDIGGFVPGTVDLPEGERYPCLIFMDGQTRRALWYLTLSADGRIARISILTVAPPPQEATALSDWPTRP